MSKKVLFLSSEFDLTDLGDWGILGAINDSVERTTGSELVVSI